MKTHVSIFRTHSVVADKPGILRCDYYNMFARIDGLIHCEEARLRWHRDAFLQLPLHLCDSIFHFWKMTKEIAKRKEIDEIYRVLRKQSRLRWAWKIHCHQWCRSYSMKSSYVSGKMRHVLIIWKNYVWDMFIVVCWWRCAMLGAVMHASNMHVM